jgi:hypothetical protein
MAAGRPGPASNTSEMAEPDPQRLLTALTTEHFTLQGARGSTISEAGTRSALFLGSVSSTLVAIGFIASVAGGTELFHAFALVVLPTLYFLGIFTWVRLVEGSIEDIFYGRAINRIRNHYLELAGDKASLFLLSAHDDPAGVIANMALRPSRWQLLFTTAAAVAVVASVVGGSALALAVSVAFDAPLGVAVAIGAVFAAISLMLMMRWDRRRHQVSARQVEALFPSGRVRAERPPR